MDTMENIVRQQLQGSFWMPGNVILGMFIIFFFHQALNEGMMRIRPVDIETVGIYGIEWNCVATLWI